MNTQSLLNPVSASMEFKRIPQLDGVRGIAILQVLVWHYSGGVHAEQKTLLAYIIRSFYLTWSGVDLFFVLSGFLIGGMLLDNRKSSNYFQVFYVRRFFRIVPIYLLLLLLGTVLNQIGQLYPERTGELISWAWYFSFTQNIWMVLHGSWNFWLGQSWSLAVEEQFYAIMPLIVWLVPNKKLPSVLVGLTSFVIVLRCLVYIMFPQQAAIADHVLLPCRMDALLLGVLCAYAVRRPEISFWLSQNTKRLYAILAGLLACAGMIVLKGWGLGSLFMGTIGFSVLALLYATFLLVAITEVRGPIRWLTSIGPLKHLGIWAYGIYLFHALIPFYLFKLFGRTAAIDSTMGVLIFLGSVLLVLLTAHLSWQYFEKPLVNFGHQWRYSAPAATQ
jgi:peptidoglycan/LPS O-acetylase OafA/YrhL